MLHVSMFCFSRSRMRVRAIAYMKNVYAACCIIVFQNAIAHAHYENSSKIDFEGFFPGKKSLNRSPLLMLKFFFAYKKNFNIESNTEEKKVANFFFIQCYLVRIRQKKFL